MTGCYQLTSGRRVKCISCALPCGAKQCSQCGHYAWHNTSACFCFICQAWYNLNANSVRRGHIVTLEKEQFKELMINATACADSNHIFDDANSNRFERKSLDRIDNSKGYELDNVRVVTWRVNQMRGNIPFDAWMLAAKHMSENNQWVNLL